MVGRAGRSSGMFGWGGSGVFMQMITCDFLDQFLMGV
jgi:hypothetical protein